MLNQEGKPRVVVPFVDIKKTDKMVIIEAEMTGLQKEDISLDLKGDELIIKGLKKDCEVPEGYTAVYRERCSFEYYRTFILGDEVEREGITAKYDKGVLKIKIPKSEKTQPQKIEISD